MGLGPHLVTPASIRAAADYQRKLFDTCVKMLRRTRTSVLVYSTCAVTLDENEANVLWALNTHPFLQRPRVNSGNERRPCSLGSTNFAHGCRFLLQQEINTAQRRNELLQAPTSLAEHGVAKEGGLHCWN
ncbi:putative nucleolar protein [Trypanosoma rangeli]|uniref:Putative nucleolar protein n=1 Tax=Trypanosoma rangeli TaxID=5698 RepID=A0A3R7L2E5_TRYRA|nr:putative nucleolar protein [Trypanosoma rangeli]RNF06196.1 putative nucleolar protein [Trypanosoma rangeli]|eukprot:RNF06196.1 putative nucleolar protein [Trypanosoma rangeli]